MRETLELAGYFAAHAVWCVSDGEVLIPLLAYELPDGTRQMARLACDTLTEGIRQGHNWLDQNPEQVCRAVLIYDGYVTLESGETDALFIEAKVFVGHEASFTTAIPYRHSEHPDGFAVHRPKFFSFEGVEPEMDEVANAFFLGVDQHEKGAVVWQAHMDQSV
jgi:hypothetical protein